MRRPTRRANYCLNPRPNPRATRRPNIYPNARPNTHHKIHLNLCPIRRLQRIMTMAVTTA